jgi:hypothetical protein
MRKSKWRKLKDLLGKDATQATSQDTTATSTSNDGNVDVGGNGTTAALPLFTPTPDGSACSTSSPAVRDVPAKRVLADSGGSHVDNVTDIVAAVLPQTSMTLGSTLPADVEARQPTHQSVSVGRM